MQAQKNEPQKAQKNENQKKQADWSKLVNSKPKIIIISVIAVILVLNILWSLMQGKVTTEMQGVRAELAKMEERIAKMEQGGVPDLASLRTEFDELKKIGGNYEARLAALLEAEEGRLSQMKKDAEAQETWVNALKKVSSEGKE